MKKNLDNREANKLAEDFALVQILTDLHAWEATHIPLLKSVSGRQLYFSVAQQAVLMGRPPTVKEVVMAQHITDRAMRTKLAEFIEANYLDLKPSDNDGRSKSLYPTEKYNSHLWMHVQEFRRIIDSHFYIIDREGRFLLKSA